MHVPLEYIKCVAIVFITCGIMAAASLSSCSRLVRTWGPGGWGGARDVDAAGGGCCERGGPGVRFAV